MRRGASRSATYAAVGADPSIPCTERRILGGRPRLWTAYLYFAFVQRIFLPRQHALWILKLQNLQVPGNVVYPFARNLQFESKWSKKVRKIIEETCMSFLHYILVNFMNSSSRFTFACSLPSTFTARWRFIYVPNLVVLCKEIYHFSCRCYFLYSLTVLTYNKSSYGVNLKSNLEKKTSSIIYSAFHYIIHYSCQPRLQKQ